MLVPNRYQSVANNNYEYKYGVANAMFVWPLRSTHLKKKKRRVGERKPQQ